MFGNVVDLDEHQ